MFRKIITLTALSFGLLIGGAIHQEVDAAAGTQGGTEQNIENKQVDKTHKFERYFNNCNIVWKNGKFTIEQTPQVDKQQQPENEVIQKEEIDEDQTNDNQSEAGDTLNSFERDVFNLTNDERTKNGLAPLQVDTELSKVAREKSQDMATNNYFDHNSPTYGSPFDMMRSFGVSYRTAGENIAKGQRSPEEVVNAWMNSPGHRENILNANFTHIGIGYVEQGNVWTQQFIGK